MGVKYLMTCACGQQTAVDSSQSGLRLPCQCGQQLEVPTHRGLMQLPRAEPATTTVATETATTGGWGRRQGVLFLAAMLLLVAAALWGWVHSRMPEDPWPKAVAEAEPQQMLMLWSNLRGGIDISDQEQGQSLKRLYDSVQFWKNMAFGLAGFAGLVALAGVLLPNPRVKK